jgi:hypothetical protein
MALNFCNNNSLSAITALPATISGGGLNLISTQTASSSSTLSFTSGIDSTYKEYIFKFINVHPATDNVRFEMNMSADSGSNYNVTKTTTFFQTWHDEGDSDTTLEYATSSDLAQSTGTQRFNNGLGNDNDQSISGTLHLFDPSNTTFVKHFISTFNQVYYTDYSINSFVAGYGNTTSAIDAVQFSMSSGAIESGVIKLYGVS